MVAEDGGGAVESGPVPTSTVRLLVASTRPHEPAAANNWPEEPTVTTLLHLKVPAESKTARTVSPPVGRFPPPKSTLPLYPALRMLTPAAFVSSLPKLKLDPAPPKLFAHSRVPVASKRARARELVPELTNCWPPRLMVPEYTMASDSNPSAP